MDTETLIEALRRPDAYPHPVVAPVELVETHISLLFFAGEFVYKVKKALDLGFLDFRALEDRKHYCEEEVRLNRRLAPEVYLGVVPMTSEGSGRARVDGATNDVIEYAVRMRRLPSSGMLAARLASGVIDHGQLDGIADLMAEFHDACRTGPGVDEFATPEALATQMEDNFAGLARRDEHSAKRLAFLRASAAQFIRGEHALLTRRVDTGRIREGHGDLHADNICFVDDRVVIYDCIEFSLPFRCGDVAAEIAFLAMDLDARGCRGFARHLVHRYAERTGDTEMPRLIGFYKLHFAAVRGKVASIRAREAAAGSVDRDASQREATRYLDLAATYALPPCLVVLCGLPASGKSTAARAIGRPFEAAVLRSDVVRKELAGIAPTTSAESAADAGIYTKQFTARTYDTLLARTEKLLGDGRSVIVDANFPTAALRRRFLDLAERLHAGALVVELRCDEETTRERLAARAHDTHEASDADWSIYVLARDRFEPMVAATDRPYLLLDGAADAETMAGRVIDTLIAAAP